jgi:hypothetical protein
MVRCVILKNASHAEKATELQNVYNTDALNHLTASKWRLRFQDGSYDRFDSARSERLSRSDLAAPIQSLL